ncbi:hypothetical protein AVEN_200965-1, partial [Araneus ventricosus]
MTRTTPELVPSPNLRTASMAGRLATTHNLTCNRPHTRRLNRVSNPESSGPEAETLQIGHR